MPFLRTNSLGFISPWILLIFGIILLIFIEFGQQLDRMYQADNRYSQSSSVIQATPKPQCIDPKDCFDLDEGRDFNF